jgi:hemoglobin-like flavoprotein
MKCGTRAGQKSSGIIVVRYWAKQPGIGHLLHFNRYLRRFVYISFVYPSIDIKFELSGQNENHMTEKQVITIRKSWRVFRGIDPKVVGDAFYSKLFHDHPELRRMFPKNMDEQYKKLIDMLSTIVSRVDDLEGLGNDIAAMAKRHVAYGVKPFHYQLVGDALLWTLQQGLGKEWNDEVRKAWALCYEQLSQAMIRFSET